MNSIGTQTNDNLDKLAKTQKTRGTMTMNKTTIPDAGTKRKTTTRQPEEDSGSNWNHQETLTLTISQRTYFATEAGYMIIMGRDSF